MTLKWEPKIGDKIRVEGDDTWPRWDYYEDRDRTGSAIEAEITSVNKRGCERQHCSPNNIYFRFDWVDSQGPRYWWHCTCALGPDFPGAPELIGKFRILSAVGQCSCDSMYMANNGCPSAKGLPCVNGKFERY